MKKNNIIVILVVVSVIAIIYYLTKRKPKATKEESGYKSCGTLLDCCIAAAAINQPWLASYEARAYCQKNLESTKPRSKNSVALAEESGMTLPYNAGVKLSCNTGYKCCMKNSPTPTSAEGFMQLEAYCASKTKPIGSLTS
jgi:hypothetical protein